MTDDLLPLWRTSDPETSERAARSVTMRAGSQKARLLAQYAAHWFGGLTDEEAGELAGITHAWKRCSDLRREGYIEPRDGVTRLSSFGESQRVCLITELGKRVATG